MPLTTLAEIDRGANDLAAALRHGQEALDLLATESTSSADYVYLQHNTGQLLVRVGDIDAGEERPKSAIAMFGQAPVGVASCLAGLAGVAAARGQGQRAARMLGACDRLLDEEGVPLDGTDEVDRAHHESVARTLLDAADWEVAFAEGPAMRRDDAVAYGLE